MTEQMKVLSPTEKRKDILRRIIGTVVAVLVFLVLIAAVRFYDVVNMKVVTGYDEFRVGVLDLGGSYDGDIGLILRGEWEFYYNQWIVTDDIDSPVLTGYLDSSDRWTGRTYGGETLPRTGYASYRMVVENCSASEELFFKHADFIPTRLYVNGQEVLSRGTMSRDEIYSVTSAEEEIISFVADGQPLELVIEIGYNDLGGTYLAPYLYKGSDPVLVNLYYNGFFLVAVACVVLVGIIIVFSTIIWAHKVTDFAPIGFVAGIVIFYLFSIEVLQKGTLFTDKMPWIITTYTSWIGGALAIFFSTYLVPVRHNLHNRLALLADVIQYGVMTALYFVYEGYQFRYAFGLIAAIIHLILFLPIILRDTVGREPLPYLRATVVFLTTAMVALGNMDVTGGITFGVNGITGILVIIIVALIVAIVVIRTKNDHRHAMEALTNERVITSIRSNALRSQINPHFLFNALTLVKSEYDRGEDCGREILEELKTHIDRVFDAQEEELIPFSKEAVLAEDYYHIEQTRRAETLPDIEWNIEAENFLVPPLILQPIIENAVKYSGIDRRTGGRLSICTTSDEDNFILTITDNGVGFDSNKLRVTSTGIRNVTLRVELLTEGTLTIDGREGTKIKIVFPKDNVGIADDAPSRAKNRVGYGNRDEDK